MNEVIPFINGIIALPNLIKLGNTDSPKAADNWLAASRNTLNLPCPVSAISASPFSNIPPALVAFSIACCNTSKVILPSSAMPPLPIILAVAPKWLRSMSTIGTPEFINCQISRVISLPPCAAWVYATIAAPMSAIGLAAVMSPSILVACIALAAVNPDPIATVTDFATSSNPNGVWFAKSTMFLYTTAPFSAERV